MTKAKSINRRPNTEELIDIVSKALILVLKNNIDEKKYEGDFDEWFNSIKELIPEIEEVLPQEIKDLFPLRKEAWKLIVQKLYGRMPYSKEYILMRYRRVYKDIPYLFYPSKKVASKLIILFTGYIDYESYNRMSWYWDETEEWETDIAYLFLGDQSLHWYVGTPDSPKIDIYKDIILRTLDDLKLDSSSAFSVGASMGGYASIVFGILCKLGGVISVHPQLCKKSAERYHLDNWKRQINQCGSNFIEVDDLIAKSNYIPPLYLEVGQNPADTVGLKRSILEINNKNCILILKRVFSEEHETKSPTKKQIYNLIKFFESSIE